MKTIFLVFIACFVMFGANCRSQYVESYPSDGNSTAFFDYFSYKGTDDFYRNNPLPDNSSFYNPILSGWYSDPSICRNGDDYFLVTSSFAYFPGVPLFHSKDLINWKQIGHVLDRPSQLENLEDRHISRGIFAPAINYNPHNNTYYMITTNVNKGNFFVKTQNPFGSWSDPVWLPDVKGIDPSLFFDDDGKAYIVNNDAPDGTAEYDGHRVIRMHEFDWKTDKTIGAGKIVVNKGSRPEDNPIWIEGPHLYKINGKYFLMSAEGGTSNQHSEVIFRADSPAGVFTPWDKNPILTQRKLSANRPYPVTCAGHADLVETKEGDWWAVFLACRPIDNQFENLGRETFLMPVKWSEDGFPYMTQGDDLIPMILRREGTARDARVTFGNFEVRDNFDVSELGLEWMTLRSPAKALYSLGEKQGYLALKAVNVSASEMKTPAFVCRRMQHHQFECETQMLFNPSESGESAGILLFKDETHQYFLAVSQSGIDTYISLIQIGKPENKTLACQKIDHKGKAIGLKVVSRGKCYDFYYTLDGSDWTLLCKDIDARYLSTANAGGFTGTVIGLYATKKY